MQRIGVTRAVVLALVMCVSGLVTSPVLAQVDVFRTIIGIAAEKARQEQLQKTQGAKPGRSTAEASSTVAEVQGRLKQLGYYRGTVDGVSGKGTSAAIRAWQADNGFASTGEIDATQYQQLMQASAAAPAGPTSVAVAGETLNLLYDTDLPYNDYTSGKDDPSLKNTTLDVCMARCAGDSMCRAFTYNSDAQFCFLKSAVAEPERFSGAVSGYKGAAGSLNPQSMSAAGAGTRALRSSEIRDLQEALNGLGYDAGKPDGRTGNKTRRAVAAFLADHPGVATGNFDTALLTAVIGTATGAAPAGGVDPKSYLDVATAQRQLVLLAIADKPERIATDYEMQRQLLEDRKAKVGPMDAAAQYEAYSAANDIEKAKLLDAYRTALVAEARAAAPEPARQVVRVRIAARTQIGSYVDGEGVVVGTPRDELFSGGKLELSLSTLGIDLVGVVPDMPDRFRLPFEDAEKASAFLDDVARRSANSYVDLVAYLTLTGFGSDSNLSGGTTATQDDFPVTVSLDKLAIVSVRNGNDTQAMPGGEELAVLRTVVRPVAADPLAIATAYGLPIIQNRLVLAADSGSEYVVSEMVRVNYINALSRFINLAVLAQNPDLAKDGIDNDLVVSLLSRAQRLQIYGDQERTSSWLTNEFQRRRARDALNTEVIPQLVAGAPPFPVPVVVIKRMRLGDYDFAGKVFPLEGDSSNSGLFILPQNLAGIAPMQAFGQLPRYLPMDELAAEQMVAGAGSYDRPSVYIAVHGELRFAQVDGKLAIRMVAERAGVYRDLTLDTQMIDLDLTSLQSDAEGLLDWRPDAEAVRKPMPEPAAKPVESPAANPVEEPAAKVEPDAGVQAILRGAQDEPQSRFDILGLRLGMTLDQAIDTLQAAYEDAPTVELQQTQELPSNAPMCQYDLAREERDELASVQEQYNVELINKSNSAEGLDEQTRAQIEASRMEALAKVREAIRQKHIDTGCALPIPTAISFAHGVEINRGQGLIERIVIYTTQGDAPVVAAVFRQVQGEQYQTAVKEAVLGKYGVPDYDGDGYLAWVEHPAMQEGMRDCRERFGLGRVPGLWLEKNCGSFVAFNDGEAILIDTRYNALATEAIKRAAAEAEAKIKKPTIKF